MDSIMPKDFLEQKQQAAEEISKRIQMWLIKLLILINTNACQLKYWNTILKIK